MTTVKELRERLAMFPDDAPIALSIGPSTLDDCSDYYIIDAVRLFVGRAQQSEPPYDYIDGCVCLN